MSKMEKILSVIAFAIIIVLSFVTASLATDYNAGSYSVGNTVTIDFFDYNNSQSLFCIEHGQSLHANDVDYQVVSRIHLRGNVSTDHNNNVQTSTYNGQLAYIISATAGGANENRYDLLTIRKSFWHMISSWVNVVGVNHSGITSSIISGNTVAQKTALNTEAENYANNLANAQASDNTNKVAIKVTSENHEGTNYVKVGPFNWNYQGTLSQTAVYDQNGAEISGIRYVTYNGTTPVWSADTSIISSGKDFYIAVPNDGKVTSITGIKGTFSKTILTAEVAFLESLSGANWQNLMMVTPGTEPDNVDVRFEYNIPMLGDLEIEKVNKDNHSVKLPGVGFIIQNKETGNYVHQDSSTGAITYVSKEEATEFITDQNGKIHIEDLVVGTYIAYETTLGTNYGYELIEGGQTITLTADQVTTAVIENKQIYVKLSGFVWVDKQTSKQSYRNDYYATNTHPTIPDYEDDKDILLDGITVRLKDKTTGETIAEAITSNGGAYQFVDVLIEKLQDYYIEFEYDGLTYTNVVPHIDVDNGSKSAENATTRDNFNKNFSVVEGTESESTGITRDTSGKQVHTLNYNINQAEHTSTLINNGQYPITANTTETGYSIYDNFEYGQEEIKFINLGLYEREQPDMAVMKDLHNVKVSINGYNHVYLYAQRFKNQGEYGDGFNVGVKFGNKYGSMSYTRAIYKADYNFSHEPDTTRELEVFVTYQIRLRNESTNLVTQINDIVDYYDSRYSIVNIGTDVSEETGTVTGSNITYDNSNYNNEYSKAIIHTNSKITSQSATDIYVQFKLSREAVLNILNDGENLDNVTEINSYSVFDTDGTTVYAGIDKDSNPGNATPGSTATYQDDTDHAPSLKLEVADARVMTGTVFVDDTGSLELRTGQERRGNGKFDDGEATVPNVEVTLTEKSGTGLTYTAVTGEDGSFTIKDYVPGDYTVTFRWGDETYTVQDYKGTIYDSSRDRTNTSWYKQDADNRLTDALDNYETRKSIDAETANANTQEPTITKMDSTTPTMAVGVEYETTYSPSSGDRYEYKIYNVDFGIVERPRQVIGIDKRVSHINITLANGMVLVDADIIEKEDGTLELESGAQYVTFMPATGSGFNENGFVRAEIDNELIQGATVTITYNIVVKNNSELDYNNENYYHYGEITEEEKARDIIKITPSGVYDYLDSEMAKQENQDNWEIISDKSTYDKVLEETPTILENYYYHEYKEVIEGDSGEITEILGYEEYGTQYSEAITSWNKENIQTARNSRLADLTVLHNAELEKEIAPTESNIANLTASKVLTNTEEIELDNHAEITKVDRKQETGRAIIITETDFYDAAETVTITGPTGENNNYLPYIILGISLLAIVVAGVVFIKRKVLNSNNENE